MCYFHPGFIQADSGDTPPPGWLACDGSEVSREQYAGIFARIGTKWGAGNGSTTFNLPALNGRFLLGKSSSGTGSSIGELGGSLNHVHTVDPPNTVTDGPSTTSGQLVGVVNVAGATHTHNVNIPQFNSGPNNPAYGTVNWIIKI